MAWGRWNGALGEVAKNNYKVSSNEKTIIYGKDIMNTVREKIAECASRKKNMNDTVVIKTIDNECYDEFSCECDDIDSICGCDCSAYEDSNIKLFNIITHIVLVVSSTFITIIIMMCIMRNRNKKIEKLVKYEEMKQMK